MEWSPTAVEARTGYCCSWSLRDTDTLLHNTSQRNYRSGSKVMRLGFRVFSVLSFRNIHHMTKPRIFEERQMKNMEADLSKLFRVGSRLKSVARLRKSLLLSFPGKVVAKRSRKFRTFSGGTGRAAYRPTKPP